MTDDPDQGTMGGGGASMRPAVTAFGDKAREMMRWTRQCIGNAAEILVWAELPELTSSQRSCGWSRAIIKVPPDITN